MRHDASEWPNRVRWFDVAWVLFSLANLAAMLLVPEWETVPFHFIWVSLTILYGFRVWRTWPTILVLGARDGHDRRPDLPGCRKLESAAR